MKDSLLAIAIGGQAATIVTSVGGAAITLASTGSVVTTTFAGSVYTAAVSRGVTDYTINSQVVFGFLAMFTSMLFGAMVVF